MERKHKARLVIIVDDDFKKKVQIKALKQNYSLSDIVRAFLTEWLNTK